MKQKTNTERIKQSEKVAWSVVNFPVELRRCFICEAHSQGLTATGLLENIVERFLEKPEKPEHILVVDEGKFKLWNTGVVPVALKNEFVGQALKWDMTVSELLQTILLRYMKRQDNKRRKERAERKKQRIERENR